MTSRLYKYRSLASECERERVKQIVVESKIWFASPSDFNDPFDCSIRPTFDGDESMRCRYWGNAVAFQLGQAGYYELEPEFTPRAMRGLINPFEEVLKRARNREIDVKPEFLESTLAENMARDSAQEERRKILTSLQEGIHQLGVLSLSTCNDELLLWSHYADSHCGLCLEFAVEPNTAPFGSSNFSSADRVNYQEEFPDISLYETDVNVWRRSVLLAKALQWEYEREYRCIDPAGPGLRDFPQEQLVGIVFGLQMPEKHREEVRGWTEVRGMMPKFYEAKRIDRRFAVEIVECL